MRDADRFKLLHGPYKTPRFRYGAVVMDEVRGYVTIVGVTDGRIPWPIGKRGRHKSPVVYRGLARAVRRESNIAVQHWWGFAPCTITKWRRALEVPATNEGTSKLRSRYTQEEYSIEAREKAWNKSRDPKLDKPRRAKIAADRRGKKRPASVVRKMAKAHRGRKHSEEARRKMSEAHKRRGTRPPAAGESWTETELRMVRELPASQVARQTGRTLGAVYNQRSKLGLPDGRRVKNQRKMGVSSST